MAKKKVVKKKAVKKASKKTVKKAAKRTSRVKPAVKKSVARPTARNSYSRKMDLVVKNLLFFAILFIVSLGLYLVSSDELYLNLFQLFSILFGAITFAILIGLLVILFRNKLIK